MNNIAVILGNVAVSRSGILLALSALCTILMALALRQRQGRPLLPTAWTLLLILLLSLPLARLVHWYCNAPQYSSFRAAMTDYSRGGFSLVGVYFALAVVLAAGRIGGWLPDTLAVLDCLAPAGALGMSVGRMSCLFTAADRSKFTLEGERFRRLPFMISSVNAAGAEEWRIATFCFEAITAFIIFAVLYALFRRLTTRERLHPEWKDGNVFFLFLALYGAVEVVLDSTCYDALYLRSNGFVSVVQIICAAGLIVSAVIYSIRSVKTNGRRGLHFVLWAVFLAGAGVGGCMEYYVQRHGNRFLFCYSIMSTMFLLCFGVTAYLQYTCGAGSETVPVQTAYDRPSRTRRGGSRRGGSHCAR